MAEITHNPPERSRVADDPERGAAWPGHRRLSVGEAGVLAASCAAAAAAAAIVLAGDVVPFENAFAAVLVANVFGLTGAGLLWVRSRPWNRLGPTLLQLAGVAFLCSLAASSSPLLFLVGNLALWAFALGVVWAVAAFPSGRLDAGGRILVALGGLLFLAVALPRLFVSQESLGVSFVGRCVEHCPRNLALVTSAPGAAHDLRLAQGIGIAVWAAALAAHLALRFVRASRPRRRILLPVDGVAFLYAPAFGLNGLALSEPYRLFVVATRILLPVGFMAAILLAHAYAGTALAGMARELGASSSVAAVEDLVRRVLDDPRARLGFWVARFGRFCDRHGRTLALDPAQEWRTWRVFGRDGERVLVLVHDPALSDDPELVQAVGSAALIELENRRLHRNLLDSISELRASRRRIVMASAAERRRIERNLHDSTQQKLVALRIQLELAREQAPQDTPLQSRLAEMGDELTDALDELRAVAHGIYPQLLTDDGLSAALHDAASRVAAHVDVEVGDDVGRLPEEMEVAVYYTCLEALQNVVKHGGDDVCARVTLRRDGRTLSFRIADDGVGFAVRDRRDGSGLTNMTDRIGAVGGSIAIRSAPRSGTTIEGRIPL